MAIFFRKKIRPDLFSFGKYFDNFERLKRSISELILRLHFLKSLHLEENNLYSKQFKIQFSCFLRVSWDFSNILIDLGEGEEGGEGRGGGGGRWGGEGGRGRGVGWWSSAVANGPLASYIHPKLFSPKKAIKMLDAPSRWTTQLKQHC